MRRWSWILRLALLTLILTSPAIAANTPADCDAAAKLSDDASEVFLSNPVAAEKKLKEAIGLCPKSASLHLNLGLVYFQGGRLKDAEDRINQAIMQNPNYAKALNAAAYIQYVKAGGDKKNGERLAAKAVELEPNNRQFKITLELFTTNVDTPPKTGQSRPDAIGVIIGNKTYRNPTLPAVKFAAQDAAIMKRYLVDSLGYDENNIILMRDATFIDLVKLFGDAQDHRGILYNRVRKGQSEVFIYYSGHGAPDSNTKKAYLIPSDADPTVIRLTSYSLDTLYLNLAKLNKEKMPKNITIVLDSCFSGGSQEGMIIPDASPIFIEATTSALNQ
jgi:tetratricopeptide (TPR) repeat protein